VLFLWIGAVTEKYIAARDVREIRQVGRGSGADGDRKRTVAIRTGAKAKDDHRIVQSLTAFVDLKEITAL